MMTDSNRLPQTIHGVSAGNSWLLYMKHILENGSFITDDREDILECGPLTVSIDEVSKDDAIIKAYGSARILEMYTEKMFSLKVIEELNSTYGDRLFQNAGVNQIDWVVDRLSRKWWTKAAAISLLKPNDPGPRIPCLTQMQFLIRGERLEVHTVFRSQNVFRSYGNMFGILAIQRLVADRLSISMGPMHSYCVSPHIYRSDLNAAKEILSSEAYVVTDKPSSS